jgi:hypothetical protein
MVHFGEDIMRQIAVKQLTVFLAVITLSLFSVSVFAENWGWDKNYGKVKRLYPNQEKTFFQLTEGKTAMNPKSGYYYIEKSHSNYQALIDLLYLAAEHRWTLYVRTQPRLDSDGHAEVIYLVVDF